MKLLSMMVTDRTVSVLLAGHPPLQANNTHPNFDKIVAALDAGKYEDLPDLFSVVNSIRKNFSQSGLEVRGNAVFVDGEAVGGPIVNRIISYMNAGRKPEWLANFQRSLRANPSYRIRDQLYAFIERSENIGINELGNIVAYKIVRALDPYHEAPLEFVSHYDNQTRHDLGTVVKMERREVNDNPEQTCASGLHACSEGYLGSYYGGGPGSWVIAVEIKPENVVSIPSDYDFAKMRACEYKVIAVIGRVDEVVRTKPSLEKYATVDNTADGYSTESFDDDGFPVADYQEPERDPYDDYDWRS